MPEDSDYYSDSDNPGPDKKDSKEPREKTALLPKSFFPKAPEVGKVCKVRVVETYEDEALVEYIHDSKDGKRTLEKREMKPEPAEPMEEYS